MYSQYYTKSNPGLWILLTDESEESCWEINKFINEAIMLNFNGRSIMDRCYFHILGYNGCLKVLQTGYLQTFVENQSEIQEVIKQIPDGDGGYFEVKSKIPIWIKSRTESKYYLAEAVNGVCALLKDYILC